MSLVGKTVVVTRASHQAGNFAQKLEAAGARVLLYPCIEIVPLADSYDLDNYDWVIFTSQNAVFAIKQLPKPIKIATIGSSTAQAVKQFLHREADFIPEQFDSQSLIEQLPIRPGERIFLPQADIANSQLKKHLESIGVIVNSVVAYKTIKASGGILSGNKIDVVTFASPSAVRYFLERLSDEGLEPKALADVCVACIGHVTQRAVRQEGLTVHVTPTLHTTDALVSALTEYFKHVAVSTLPDATTSKT